VAKAVSHDLVEPVELTEQAEQAAQGSDCGDSPEIVSVVLFNLLRNNEAYNPPVVES
jgi:hypothetical protein